jgi:Bromodomain extra-terminal - transcription regulation
LRKKWEDRFKKVLSECSPGAARGGDAAGAATKKSAPTPDKSKPSSGAAAAGGGNSNDMNSTSFPPPMALPAPNAAPKTTIQDRRAFAKSLYSLTKEDLGKVLVELEVKCPAAMRRNAAEDEVELNIDKISPPSAFMELKKMIDHFIATSSAQRKTTKSGGGGGGAGAASSKKAKTK